MQGSRRRKQKMSFKDVIKTSVYQSIGAEGNISPRAVLWTLAAAALIGLYLFAVYKNTSKTAFYSKDLNITIAGIPVVIAAIMVAMQSNLIVSLGMVGALSIVRFRTAVRNPLDLLYLFWSISAGIICGVGLKVLALLLCIVMTALILLLQLVPLSQAPSVLILRTGEKETDWDLVKNTIRNYASNVKEKSRSTQTGETEIIFELRIKDEENLLHELKQYEVLKEISLLSHDGEYRM